MSRIAITTGTHILQDTFSLAFKSTIAVKFSTDCLQLFVKDLGHTTVWSELNTVILVQQMDKIMTIVQIQHWASHEINKLWTSITLNFSVKNILFQTVSAFDYRLIGH